MRFGRRIILVLALLFLFLLASAAPLALDLGINGELPRVLFALLVVPQRPAMSEAVDADVSVQCQKEYRDGPKADCVYGRSGSLVTLANEEDEK